MAENFDSIFRRQEYQFLLGEGKKGLYLLAAILFLTFFALGHILGGQKELNKRMSNPFTNWVNIPVLTSNAGGIELMEEETDDQIFLDSFHISSIIPYEITWFKGLERGFRRTRKLTVRSINENDPLRDVILSKDNIVAESREVVTVSCDLIVTEEAMNMLDYDIEGYQFLLPIFDNEYDDDHIALLMPVSHIVSDLPSGVDVIVSDRLMRLLNSNAEKSEYIDQSPRNIFSFISEKQFSEQMIGDLLAKDVVIDEFEVNEVKLNGSKLFRYSVEIRREISFTDFRFMQKNLYDRGILSIIEFNCDGEPDVALSAYYYALNFSELSMVKSFRAHAKEKYDLLLSLAQVESRDNFYLISRLTSLLIFLLVILSGFSIILYIQNIVSNHLEKIKPNLGTLKAFGLSDAKIGKLYLAIVSKFYGVASLIALAFLILYKLVQVVFRLDLHFRLVDIKLVLIWVTIYLMLYFLFKRLIAKILYRSPGDLIYNR